MGAAGTSCHTDVSSGFLTEQPGGGCARPGFHGAWAFYSLLKGVCGGGGVALSSTSSLTTAQWSLPPRCFRGFCMESVEPEWCRCRPQGSITMPSSECGQTPVWIQIGAGGRDQPDLAAGVICAAGDWQGSDGEAFPEASLLWAGVWGQHRHGSLGALRYKQPFSSCAAFVPR